MGYSYWRRTMLTSLEGYHLAFCHGNLYLGRAFPLLIGVESIKVSKCEPGEQKKGVSIHRTLHPKHFNLKTTTLKWISDSYEEVLKRTKRELMTSSSSKCSLSISSNSSGVPRFGQSVSQNANFLVPCHMYEQGFLKLLKVLTHKSTEQSWHEYGVQGPRQIFKFSPSNSFFWPLSVQ